MSKLFHQWLYNKVMSLLVKRYEVVASLKGYNLVGGKLHKVIFRNAQQQGE
jgi:hypothetical protein